MKIITAGRYTVKMLGTAFKWQLTHPFLPQVVRDGIKAEWQSDVWAVPAIAEKVVMLEPGQRDNLELLVDALLAGDTITVTK